MSLLLSVQFVPLVPLRRDHVHVVRIIELNKNERPLYHLNAYQAARVREIYEQRKEEGIEAIAIVGDFNDTPDSAPLQPLLGEDSDLRDITEHEKFVGDDRPGTYGNGKASNKIDYVLLSPYLFERVMAEGVWRKGV